MVLPQTLDFCGQLCSYEGQRRCSVPTLTEKHRLPLLKLPPYPTMIHSILKTQVQIEGDFREWELQVMPPLSEFVDRTRRAQVSVCLSWRKIGRGDTTSSLGKPGIILSFQDAPWHNPTFCTFAGRVQEVEKSNFEATRSSCSFLMDNTSSYPSAWDRFR